MLAYLERQINYGYPFLIFHLFTCVTIQLTINLSLNIFYIIQKVQNISCLKTPIMPNIFLEFQYKSSFFGDNLKLKPNCMRLQFPGPMFPDIYMVRKANNFISRYFINLTIAYLSDMRSTISKTQESYQILSNFIMLRFRSLLQKSSQGFFIGG